MTLADDIAAIAAAIKNDTALTAWCLTTFSTAPVVWIGIDRAGPPPATDYPLVAILEAPGHIRGAAKREIVSTVLIGLAVENDRIDTTAGFSMYTGFKQLEALRELVEDAVFRLWPSACEAERVPDEEGQRPPVFAGFTLITITRPKSTRQALPGR